MIALTPHPEGVLLPVVARPGARANELVDEREEALLVAVTAPPEDGKANAALVETIAEGLGLRRSQVEMLHGGKHRHKRFLVRGVTVEDLHRRIEAALTPTIYESQDPEV
jgi:uncharacterized protein (TIGR00251 family)